MTKKITITLVLMALLSGCASNSKVVSRDDVYRNVSYGAVVDREEVTLRGTDTGIGSYIGSAAAIHDATSDSFLGFVLRGLAGALVGAVAEEALTRREGVLYTIETERGGVLEVATTKKELRVGTCVRISHGGRGNTHIKETDAANCHGLAPARAEVSAS